MKLSQVKEHARSITAVWLDRETTPNNRHTRPLAGFVVFWADRIPSEVFGVAVREGRLLKFGALVFVDARSLVRAIRSIASTGGVHGQS